jgi:hypothetical protein
LETGEIYYEEHLEIRKREIATSTMASQFFSTILDLICEQTLQTSCMAFVDTATRFHLLARGNKIYCICEDDGSMVRLEKLKSNDVWSIGKHLCSLEAKAQYTVHKDDQNIVSGRVESQIACDLLGSAMNQYARGDPPSIKSETSVSTSAQFHSFLLFFSNGL